MKRNFVFPVVLMTVMVLFVPGVFAGGAQEAADQNFSARLESALEESEFNEEEAEAIVDSVDEGSWEEVGTADPQIVAQALGYARSEGIDLETGKNGLLALELARNALRLEKEENREKTVVAQATREAVRTMLGQIEDWKNGELAGNLGEIVRSTVRTEARKAAQERASQQNKGKETASEAKAGTPAGDTPAESAGNR
ncbi:MAG: hypothetical protein K9L68_10090 [Spirochaetales bacterium]|nr:hypothetical protein [Spirochaetales bacterium]MCF7938933.1 hypothetical protein [Spirochaetales bacterium]